MTGSSTSGGTGGTTSPPAGHDGTGLPGVRRLVAAWPWITATAAAVLVHVVVGAGRHFDYHGITGFSTTNYGWLAFTLVGGFVFAWRLARYPVRPPLLAALRPVIAAGVSWLLCFAAVTVTGLVFLPGQSLAETLSTDALGRSLPVAAAVLVFGVLAELGRAGIRRLSAGR
ncbi:hypothetical protein ACFYVL_04765 [Streptomyces sp. NPDC004111]|uniref:hypothetical protein n=1 Tax=Streptomyces sp. NPDC004111 TaxID=3364690 RepID=UPI0036CA4FCA